MSTKKKIIVIVAITVAVALLALLGYFAWDMLTPNPGEKTFTVTVVHADGGSKEFKYTTEEEMVGAVLMEDGLIEGEEGQYGLYIKVVDGEKAVYEEDGAYWSFYIGEDYASTGVDMTPITDGAAYKLVYTKA